MDHSTLVQAIHDQLSAVTPETVVPYDFVTNDLHPPTYTLNLFPRLPATLLSLITDLKNIDPQHFFMPPSKLHLTLLGQIKNQQNSPNLISAISEILPKYQFNFHLQGLGSDFSTVSGIAYPDFDIFQFRYDLCQKLNLSNSIYARSDNFFCYIGWINILRYTQKPKSELIDFIKHHQDTDFGQITSIKLQLLQIESKTLAEGKYQVIHEF